MARRRKTFKEAQDEYDELLGTAAINRALANYLRTRYLSRDSGVAHARIDCNGRPVPEDLIELKAGDLEAEAAEMETSARSYEGAEVVDG